MVSKNVALSIIIPCYNEQDSIAKCLDALIDQKDAIAEIIVVDNNSTDNTVKIIESYSERYSFIYLDTETRQGVHFVRSHGFNMAKSDIIARVDADVIVDPGWAKALLNYYVQPGNEDIGAASGFNWYYDLPFRRLTSTIANAIIYDTNRAATDSFYSLYGANMSLKREAWEKIRSEICMISGIMEDLDIGYHTHLAGYRVGYVPDASAGVSGRRMRMSPLRYWKYNKLWWITYRHHGLRAEACKFRFFAWIGNAAQVFIWAALLLHNPKTNRFGIVTRSDKQEERSLP